MKVLRTVAIVAGAVALAATGVGLVLPLGSATLVMGVSVATIASVASAVSAIASAGAMLLQKKPEMKGSINQTVIGNNMAIPYAVGRTYSGGFLVFDGSQPTADYKNRTTIMVVSAAGPIDSFESFKADYATIPFSGQAATGYYATYLWRDWKLGNRPETAFAAPPGRPALIGWTSAHKMSGYAGYAVTVEFDEDGEKFAGGMPALGVVFKGVKVYDPRLDSTYPGGSGSHRWDDESTFTWSENPALHALTYARGRFIEKNADGSPKVPPVKIVGIGKPKAGIDLPAFVEFANLCDLNGWTVGGTVYEAPQMSKWDNLKRFCQAGGAMPVYSGGVLTLNMSRPRTSLFTLTRDDVVDGTLEVQAMKSYRDRINSCVSRYRNEAHRWEYVQNAAVTPSTYLAEDGELKTREVQFDLVQDMDQAAQLAAYEVVNGREFVVRLTAGPRMMLFKLGEAGTLDIPEAGLNEQLAVITERSIDPATGMVQLTLETETTAKHAYALAQSGVAPETPTLTDPELVDQVAAQGDASLFEIPDLVPVTIEADYTGAINAGQLPRSIQAKLMRGTVDVTTDAAWSINVDSGAIAASIGAADGSITLDVPFDTASAVVTVTATIGTVAKNRSFLVTKHLAGTPSTGSGGAGPPATDTSFASISSTSMAAISDDLIVTVGSAGVVDLTAPLSVTTTSASPAGTYEVFGRWQWWNGASWTDLGGGEVASDPDASVFYDIPTYEAVAGSLSVAASKTGLTPGSSHKFRLMARKASGTRAIYFSGTASAVPS